jgi:hypothetical protein
MSLSSRRPHTAGLAFAIAIAVVLLAPIAVYIETFGIAVATDHARWGEFGSAMSGIYSVFTAFATLLLLTVQLGLQRKQVDLQRQINQHEYDVAYVQQARADLEFYIHELNDALSRKVPSGGTFREVLLDRFRPSDEEMLNDSRLLSLALELDRSERRCIGIWFAVYQGLVGLTGGTGPQFEVNKNAAPLKLIATLTHEVCVALDNFHHIRTSGRLAGHYRFSPLLVEN